MNFCLGFVVKNEAGGQMQVDEDLAAKIKVWLSSSIHSFFSSSCHEESFHLSVNPVYPSNYVDTHPSIFFAHSYLLFLYLLFHHYFSAILIAANLPFLPSIAELYLMRIALLPWRFRHQQIRRL